MVKLDKRLQIKDVITKDVSVNLREESVTQVYWIVAAIVAVSAIIAALLVSQSAARNQRRRAEIIQRLNKHNRQLRSLLRVLPGTMVSPKLLSYITDTLKANIQEILDNRPDSPVLYQSELTELETGKASGASEVSELRSLEQVNVVRSALAALAKEVQSQHKQGKLDKRQAQQLLDEVDTQLASTAGIFLERTGLGYERNGKYREAITAWQKAIDTYANSRMKAQFADEALKLRGLIKRAQNAWREQKQHRIAERDELRRKAEEEKPKTFDEDWQKPNLYD